MTTLKHRISFVVAACLGVSTLATAQVAAPSKPASAEVATPTKTDVTKPVDDSEPVQLSMFTVSTDRDRGYYSSNSAAGGVLTDKPIKELAVAITVVNRDLLDDLQTMSIGEALQFSAAFSPETGLIRGQPALDPSGQFTNRVGNATNGVPDSGSVERIEMIKGPPSMLMSSSSAGGSVNITPKRAKWHNYSETELQYGNYQKRSRVEFNRVLTPKLSTVFGIQYTDAAFNGNILLNQFVVPEFDYDRRWLVFNSTTYRPFKNTELGIDIEQVRDRSNQGSRTASRFATVTKNGVSVRLPWYLAYNMPTDYSMSGPDILTIKDHRYITARWTQKWAAHLRTEGNVYNQWYNEKNNPGIQNFEESTAVAGLNGKRAIRQSTYDKTQLAQRTTQLAFRAVLDYDIRDSKHQLVLKYNYYSFYTDSTSFRAYKTGTNSLTGLVAANETKGPYYQVEDVSVDQLNSYDRSIPAGLDYLWRYTQDTHDNPQRQQGNIIYTNVIPTRIGTFNMNAGVSYHSQIKTYQTKFALVNGELTNPRSLSRPHRWGSAPSAGIIYEPTAGFSVYVNYLESFQVPSNFNTFNELFPNRSGKSYEAGIKLDLFDRKVTGTLSYFNTIDKNRTTNDPNAFNINTRDINGLGARDPGFDPLHLAVGTSLGADVAIAEYKAKGFDFELSLQPIPSFQAVLSAAFVDSGFSNDPNSSLIGMKLAGTSSESYGALAKYIFLHGKLKGLSIGGGYRYSSDRYLNRVRQFPTVFGSPYIDYWQPPAASLLIFSKYAFKLGKYDAWVQLNVDNILKTKRYINDTATFSSIAIFGLETPMVWRVTSGLRF